jgi:hypothetical protein
MPDRSVVNRTHQGWKLTVMYIGIASAVVAEAVPFVRHVTSSEAVLWAGLGALAAVVGLAVRSWVSGARRAVHIGCA